MLTVILLSLALTAFARMADPAVTAPKKRHQAVILDDGSHQTALLEHPEHGQVIVNFTEEDMAPYLAKGFKRPSEGEIKARAKAALDEAREAAELAALTESERAAAEAKRKADVDEMLAIFRANPEGFRALADKGAKAK